MIDRRAALAGLGAAAALSGSACAAPQPAPDGTVEIGWGIHPRQKLDLYPQAGLKDAPVVLFVHGGGWAAGSRKSVYALPDFARRHGFLLASTGYRFWPDADAGGVAQDVADATRWLLRNVRKYGGDPDRVFLLGHSSGAHAAALAAVGEGRLGVRRKRLGGVVSLDSSGFDMVEVLAALRRADPPPATARLFEQAFGDRAAALSPMRLIRPGTAYPPFLLLHAAGTAAGPQGLRFATLLRMAGGRAEVVAAPGDTHMSLLTGLGLPADPEGERVAAFLRTAA